MVPNKLKIIVAEDHEIQRTYMCMLINKLGYDAIPAENGIEGLRLVRDSDAQILISDLNMPNLNGIELTEKVRQLKLDHYVHIIMVTGGDDEHSRRKALEAGVDDFMPKGPNPAMLTARIRAATRLIYHEKTLSDQNRILKNANDRIENDLRAAAIAQRRLLPDIQGDILGFRVASAFVPSAIVSGDMFGCFPLNDDKLGFYTVDVSGHGVHASLLSVAIGHLITPEYFRNKAIRSNGNSDPAALVTALNARFYSDESDEYFTMFCGIVDQTTGQFDYCQAGHPSPFFIHNDGSAEEIGDGGYPVGMLDFAMYETKSLHFEQGCSLVMCSDAAIEATSKSQTQFGNQRLKTIIETNISGNPASIPNSVISALEKWREGEPLEDDLTVVSLERTISHDSHNIV